MYKDYILDKKAILFDLDGTIVDNLFYWEMAVNTVATRFEQIYSLQNWMIYKGYSLKHIWKENLKESKIKTQKSNEDLTKETIEEYIKIINNNPTIEPRNGFWSLLGEFKSKNFLVGVVSNSTKNIVEFMLKKLDIDINLFDVILTGDKIKNSKPHPEIYITAANKLKLSPKEILVFEDSPVGATSADRAGMDVLVIWSGNISQYEYPEKVLSYLDNFESLPGNLDQTFLEYFKKMAQRAAPPGETIQ